MTVAVFPEGIFRIPLEISELNKKPKNDWVEFLENHKGEIIGAGGGWEIGYVVNLRGEEVVAEHVNVAGERGGFVVPPNEEVFITKGQGVPMEPLTAIRIESRAGELIGEVRADGAGEGLLVAVFPEGVYRIPLELIEQRGESRRYVGPWGVSKPKEDWMKFLKRRKGEIVEGGE